MRTALAVVLAILCPLFALAQAPAITSAPAPERPAWKPMTGHRGKIVRLAAEKPVKWVLAEEVPEGTGPELEPSDDGKRCVFVSNTEGRFKVIAYAADSTEAARVVVVIGGDAIAPKPVPVDPLVEKLRVAYAADTGGKKSESRKALAELYRQAQRVADDQTVTSVLDLATRLRTASAVLVAKDQLVGVRKVLAEAIAEALGSTDAALSPELRGKAGSLFSRIETALNQLEAKP